MLCFRKFPLAKKVMDMRGGGERVSRFSVKNFVCHSAENFRRGSLQCFIIIGYRKKVRDKRERERERERRDYDFLSLLLCLTVTKRFVEEPFGVSESFGYRKILCLRGEYHDFR